MDMRRAVQSAGWLRPPYREECPECWTEGRRRPAVGGSPTPDVKANPSHVQQTNTLYRNWRDSRIARGADGELLDRPILRDVLNPG